MAMGTSPDVEVIGGTGVAESTEAHGPEIDGHCAISPFGPPFS